MVSLEVTRMATARKNALGIEVYGSNGALRFDLESLNHLDVCLDGADSFSRQLVTEQHDPYIDGWWPPGHVLGWDATFTNQAADFLAALAAGREPTPSFEDGIAVQRVLAAIEASSARGGQLCRGRRRSDLMGRPFTLFTGQWVDLPLEEVARLAAEWGYDGLEVAVSGEHLDAWRWDDEDYVAERLGILEKHGLQLHAISNHLTGQAICDDPIDFRHQAIVRDHVWGDGDPEGVRQRAAEEMKLTARLAQKLGVKTVVGFTGSSIWQYVAMFPPVPAERIEAGYQDFADRWNPILDVFDECGVRFAHEVHPSEIAYDYWTTRRALDAIDNRPAFGINWDPSHMMWQGIDPVAFISDFADRIYHVDCKDTRMRMGGGRNGILSSHLPWDDQRRGWTFVSTGHGDIPWEDCFRALTAIGYDGPISVEWEDAGMDRLRGAPEALERLRALDFEPPAQSFDAAFSKQSEGEAV